jgi:ribose 5-phosphate isomerase B
VTKGLLIAADHGGFELKERLKQTLDRLGVGYEDLGTSSTDSVDYPDLGHAAARAVSRGEAERALLVCGTGLGMSMTANRHRGVRAALVYDEETARLAREHNDANVLALGGRFLDPDRAERILEIWLQTPFQGGRHDRRIRKIDSPEG